MDAWDAGMDTGQISYLRNDQRITTIFQRRKLGWKELSKLVRLKHNQEAQLSGKTREHVKKTSKTPKSYNISCLPIKMLQKQPYLHHIFLHLIHPPIATFPPPYLLGPCLKPLPSHIARWPCNHLLSNWKIPNSWICHLRPTSLKNLPAKTQKKKQRFPMPQWIYDSCFFWRIGTWATFEFRSSWSSTKACWLLRFIEINYPLAETLVHMFKWKNTASCHCDMCKQCWQCT